MFQCKEQLTHYMLKGHIHLSKKDFGFYNNLKYMIEDKRPITSNQDKLFNKLLLKYKRQLTKLGHDINFLMVTPWKTEVVESSLEYLTAKISINGNNIEIRSPFNNQFVQEFRRQKLNDFSWNKLEKVYKAPANTYSLKLAVNLVNKHYENVSYCQKIQGLLKEVQNYDGKYWEPTLVKINANYYILAMNPHLYEAVKDIELNNNPKTLFLLSQYGITIDKSITENHYALEVAGKYDTTIDLEYFDELCKILKLLEVEHVFTSRDIVYNKQVSNEIKLSLLQYGITCSPYASTNHNEAVLIKSTTHSHDGNKRLLKIITLTNSRPIKIR